MLLYLLLSLLAVPFIVWVFKLIRNYRQISLESNCFDGYARLKRKVTYCGRYNELAAIDDEIDEWHNEYDTRVDTGKLTIRYAELNRLIVKKRAEFISQGKRSA